LVRKAKVPDKYKIINQVWTTIDQKNGCIQKPVICPICRDEYNMTNYGHLDIYLNSSKQTKKEVGANIVCKHAHFTMDIDRGRNVWCIVERIMIPKKNLKIKYTIHDDKLPYWVKEKLEG
jgi:hypothetical protein